jgi:hypothetical protein
MLKYIEIDGKRSLRCSRWIEHLRPATERDNSFEPHHAVGLPSLYSLPRSIPVAQ